MGDDGVVEVLHETSFEVDLQVYRLSAAKKTAYALAEKATAELVQPNSGKLDVHLRFKRPMPRCDVDEVVRQFFQELLDQELREQIAEETAPIRTLILAHAFSKADLIKRE